METDQLIRTLGADVSSVRPPLGRFWAGAIAASAVMAFIVFSVLCGLRPDFAEAANTIRFLLKFVVTLSLGVTAYLAARAVVRPGAPLARKLRLMALPILVLTLAVAAELYVLPADQWMGRVIGTNNIWCLGLIPTIGFAPLMILIGVMRMGAPTRPTLAGAIAGLLAGGIAATFYAAHCFEDSPLFVATWYTMAITILAVVGAGAGRFLLRW